MIRYRTTDFEQMERLFRLRLINSLSGFKSANLVGTKSKSGIHNLAIVSSVTHLGSNPALMGFVMRPAVVQRDTYQNILDTKFYTFNHVSEAFFKKAHQTSARYPLDVSEFEEVDLQPEYLNNFPAPFVKESSVKMGLAIREILDIRSNNTILMVGEILELYLPESCLLEDGYLDLEKAGTITVSGLDGYHTTQKITRLSHAKPGEILTEINTNRVVLK